MCSNIMISDVVMKYSIVIVIAVITSRNLWTNCGIRCRPGSKPKYLTIRGRDRPAQTRFVNSFIPLAVNQVFVVFVPQLVGAH